MDTATEPMITVDAVEDWRFEELQRAGYPDEVARPLARKTYVDLHLACELLQRGATVDQALRILL